MYRYIKDINAHLYYEFWQLNFIKSLHTIKAKLINNNNYNLIQNIFKTTTIYKPTIMVNMFKNIVII